MAALRGSDNLTFHKMTSCAPTNDFANTVAYQRRRPRFAPLTTTLNAAHHERPLFGANALTYPYKIINSNTDSAKPSL